MIPMSNTSRGNWQDYIAERDELFLRSRSVSVTEMTTTLAHELNQPLGAVSNILNGLKLRLTDQVLDTHQIYDAVDLALQQTQFAARVIAQMRDIVEAKQPEFVKFNVLDLLNQSVRLLDWVFSANSVRILLTDALPENNLIVETSQNDPAELLVCGDRTMLQQIFTNLLRNAVDALCDVPKERRVIRITIANNSEGIKIEIKDNGHGLLGRSEDDLFTPFQSSKKEGMGVGLSICRSFVELHQGRLWISPNKDVGCTAHVLLRSLTSGESCE